METASSYRIFSHTSKAHAYCIASLMASMATFNRRHECEAKHHFVKKKTWFVRTPKPLWLFSATWRGKKKPFSSWVSRHTKCLLFLPPRNFSWGLLCLHHPSSLCKYAGILIENSQSEDSSLDLPAALPCSISPTTVRSLIFLLLEKRTDISP